MMSIAAINFNISTTAQQRYFDSLAALRDARKRVLQCYAALDQMRDDGAVGAYLAGEDWCGGRDRGG
jgi:hypothetical protein